VPVIFGRGSCPSVSLTVLIPHTNRKEKLFTGTEIIGYLKKSFMDKNEKNTEIVPKDLPQSEVFNKKEIFQHPQPADAGKPLRTKNARLLSV